MTTPIREYAAYGKRLVRILPPQEVFMSLFRQGRLRARRTGVQQSLDARRAQRIDAKEIAMRLAYGTAVIIGATSLGMTSHASWAQQTVKATLLSSSIQLDTHNVKTGRVTIDVKNAADNNMEHELVVLKTDLADDALPVSKGTVPEHKLRKVGEVEDIAPGMSKHMSFRLTPGHYVLICNKAGHYTAGMHTALAVTP
jgi:uncharacterized cupredoxin-like copper-binding protein